MSFIKLVTLPILKLVTLSVEKIGREGVGCSCFDSYHQLPNPKRGANGRPERLRLRTRRGEPLGARGRACPPPSSC